jgi:hypothetical protein
MIGIVNSLSKTVVLDTTKMNYLAFQGVTRADVDHIDESRRSIGKHLRMVYEEAKRITSRQAHWPR